jgi:hypothetical protein
MREIGGTHTADVSSFSRTGESAAYDRSTTWKDGGGTHIDVVTSPKIFPGTEASWYEN